MKFVTLTLPFILYFPMSHFSLTHLSIRKEKKKKNNNQKLKGKEKGKKYKY